MIVVKRCKHCGGNLIGEIDGRGEKVVKCLQCSRPDVESIKLKICYPGALY